MLNSPQLRKRFIYIREKMRLELERKTLTTMSHFGKFIFRTPAFTPNNGIYLSYCQRKSLMTSAKVFFEYKTMNDIKKKLAQRLENEVLKAKKNTEEDFAKYMVKSQSELPVRSMKDSFDVAFIPLSTDKDLRNRYITFIGNVRVGRLMEDVDLFAGHVSYKHTLNPALPSESGLSDMIVTVSVNSLDTIQEFKPDFDIRVSGHVSWVGLSSLEVMIWLEQPNNGKWERIMTALLLMAARNRLTMGASIVNKIEAETPEEQLLLQGGEERKRRRLKLMNESLVKTVPSEEEHHLIHNLFIKTMDSNETFRNKKILPPNGKWMRDVTLSNLVFCHPQYRNLHNKIFGGFLIRQALELSWNVGFLFGMQIPRLIHISDIGFYTPVDVGSLLKLHASVTYAEDTYIQVFVLAESLKHGRGEGKSTTSFNFTYNVKSSFNTLYPYTYLEAMKYIDGRRHFQEFKNLKIQHEKLENS